MSKLIIKAMNIRISFGNKEILNIDELCIYEHDRLGLIGMNGSGKSTLLKILYGDLKPDKGEVLRYGEMSYFRQFDETSRVEDGKLIKELQVKDQLDQAVISGGEHVRLRLANVLSNQQHILLLDEPTSNLDQKGRDIVKEKLKQCDTFLIVSHDRALLDEVCTGILAIEEHTIKRYDGNYTHYQTCIQEEKKEWQLQYEKQMKEKRRLELAYEDKVRRAKKAVKKPRKISNSDQKTRGKVALRKSYGGKNKALMKNAKAIQSRIEHMELIEKPKQETVLQIDLQRTHPPGSPYVVRIEHLHFAYGNHVIFQDEDVMIANRMKTAIIGENGCGKSTFFRLLLEGYEGIKIAPNVKFGLLTQDFHDLDEQASLLENVKSRSVQKEVIVRSVLHHLLFKEQDLQKPVHVLSGGEKLRAALAKLLVSDCNVILLDEPTNYLDPLSVDALTNVFQQYPGCCIFISHDPAFLNEVADQIVIINEQKIQLFQGTYLEYEQTVKITHTQNSGIERTMIRMRLAKLDQQLYQAKDVKEKESLKKEIELLVDELK